MKEITGIIDHRILLNYRIDPEIMQETLPNGFRPKLVSGYAIGGICQVSLSNMRPKGFPLLVKNKSHNAAHRVAVETDRGEGVYIFRRDTSSYINALAGGRIFPGRYKKLDFTVHSSNGYYKVSIKENDTELMRIAGVSSDAIPEDSIFNNAKEVSLFFEKGNLGWSDGASKGQYDAIELKTTDWNMTPLEVETQYSGFFTNESLFPKGSVEFDSAMVMSDLSHSWISKDGVCDVCS